VPEPPQRVARNTGRLIVGMLWLASLGETGCAATLPSTRPAASAAKETHMDDDDAFMPQADRNPPPKVAPLIRDGIRYERHIGGPDDPQTGGMIAAYDVASGKRLWMLVVFDNVRNPDFEGDAQDVFVAEMHFDVDGTLRVTDERGDHWVVDVKARTSVPAH
jgi:hypothetical protein